MPVEARIYVAGHTGLAGSAILRRLQSAGYNRLLLRRHAELDLLDQAAVRRFFAAESPDYVFLAAAKVGGILANRDLPAEFIHDNLVIAANVMDATHRAGVERFLFLGSSCIYPKHCPQPMKEDYLLTGPLEPTNRPYAVAKIAGVEMCSAYNRQYGTKFLAAMPTNLYGPGDNYDLQNSHVLPALIRKMHEARVAGAAEVVVWGSGTVRREFLHSDDMAEACVMLMNLPDETFVSLLGADDSFPLVNIGCGKDVTVAELAGIVAEAVGFKGRLVFDRAKPDGTPRKLLDVTRLTSLGWRPRLSLKEGIRSVYAEYCRAAAVSGR